MTPEQAAILRTVMLFLWGMASAMGGYWLTLAIGSWATAHDWDVFGRVVVMQLVWGVASACALMVPYWGWRVWSARGAD